MRLCTLTRWTTGCPGLLIEAAVENLDQRRLSRRRRFEFVLLDEFCDDLLLDRERQQAIGVVLFGHLLVLHLAPVRRFRFVVHVAHEAVPIVRGDADELAHVASPWFAVMLDHIGARGPDPDRHLRYRVVRRTKLNSVLGSCSGIMNIKPLGDSSRPMPGRGSVPACGGRYHRWKAPGRRLY